MRYVARLLLRERERLSHAISRLMLPSQFSILSDDCWGGQLFRQLHLPYSSPTVGLYVEPASYLEFVELVFRKELPDLNFVVSDLGFPVAVMQNDIRVCFVHYKSSVDAKEKFMRRFERIFWSRLLVKIDFGKPGYDLRHIIRWNSMQLKNSIALYSPSTPVPPAGIHNGVLIDEWTIDGAAMFDVTRRYFNIYEWVRSGKVSNSAIYRIANAILLDPSSPRRFLKTVHC